MDPKARDNASVSPQRPDSQALLQRLAQGDTGAFWTLWEAHRVPLLRLCRRLLKGRPEDAEDALSDTMLRAWEKLRAGAPEIVDAGAWLRQVAHNACMDRWRERSRTARYVDEAPAAGTEAAGNASGNPEASLLGHELQERLLRAIDALPPRLRASFVLTAIDGCSSREAAAQLNTSAQNVRDRVREAREALRAHFQEDPTGVGTTPAGVRLERVIEAIPSRVAEIRFVQITLPSGATASRGVGIAGKLPRREVSVETLRRYLQRHPHGWKKRLDLAHLLYALGRWEQAIEEYSQVVAARPELTEAWLRLATVFRFLERFDDAVAAYDGALRHAPKPATAHHIRGQIERCRRRYPAALEEFRRAAALEPGNAGHWQALAWAYQHVGDLGKSLEAWDQALELNPDDTVALTNSRSALLAQGRREEIERRLERAVALDPNAVAALVYLANLRCERRLVEGEEGRRTRALLSHARRLAPHHEYAAQILAQFHVCRGEWERAVAFLAEFAEDHARSPKAWRYFAHWLFRTGRFDAAAEAALQAHRLEGPRLTNHLLLCQVLAAAGRWEELRALVEAMLQAFPEAWEARAAAGEALVRHLQEPERACRLSQEALQRQPDQPEPWFAHGRILMLAERPHAAIAAMEMGWSRLPRDRGCEHSAPLALRTGLCYRATGAETPARQWFETAQQHARAATPFSTAAYHTLGQALEALGRGTEAALAYQTALDCQLLYPERTDAEQSLDRLRLP